MTKLSYKSNIAAVLHEHFIFVGLNTNVEYTIRQCWNLTYLWGNIIVLLQQHSTLKLQNLALSQCLAIVTFSTII